MTDLPGDTIVRQGPRLRLGSARRPTFLGLLLVACVGIGAVGCRTYTAYLHLDPIDPIDPIESASGRLDEAQRREADAIVEGVVTEHGFMRDPRETRLQQKSRNSVQFDYSVISSYVPKGSVTGHRLTIASVIRKADGRFAVLVRDLSAGDPTLLVVAIQDDLAEAFAEHLPGYELRFQRSRFGPRGTY